MKILNIKIAFFLIFISTISCRAQQVYPLNTLMENILPGGHIKDLNNELGPYIGTYKTIFQGNEITLIISKQENKPEKSINKTYYLDALVIRYIVKNSEGQILQDTSSMNFPADGLSYHYIYSIATKPLQNTVIFIYSGTNCGVGWGDIYLHKINNTQISWTYRMNGMVISDQNCPGNPNTTIYLPDTEGLIFTKQ